MSVGKLGAFDIAKDNWGLYIERLEQYFIANDVKEVVKVATLITVIGSDAYELMVNLCTPVKPSTKTFNDLVTIMKGHLQPNPSVLAERFKFRRRVQKQDETIAEYVAELKRMTKYCGFGSTSLSEHLRDQFVCGLLSEGIRQRLFTEDNIQFDTALKLAVAMEAAEADAALVLGGDRTSSYGGGTPAGATASMHQLRPTGRRHASGAGAAASGFGSRDRDHVTRAWNAGAGTGGGPSGMSGVTSGRGFAKQKGIAEQTLECGVCGKPHNADSCKYRRYVCRVCNTEGHLKKMCPRLRRSAPLHNVHEEKVVYLDSEAEESDEVNNYSIEIGSLKNFAPYTIEVRVNNNNLAMEIDTGSAISCISFDCYQRLFTNCNIQSSDLRLKYYTGELVKPVGRITPLVEWNGKCKQLNLYIVESGKTSLLGRQWLEELGIKVPATACHSLSTEKKFDLNGFSSRYCEVFEEGLGRFTGGSVGFHLRPEARPVFLRARPLAYALREPVERALDQLVRQGVITPTNTSDWATPIVPVMKKDGTIRVCGDFKLTLNKCLEVDRFPLPRVEDLLTKLHGGEKFSKIDLSQAYAQFELDDSKKYAVINTHRGLFMYNRLIYGLASSPGIFQRKLEQLFGDMPRVGVFLDDLIITGTDNKSHLATLNEVFERLRKYGLKVKADKCSFFKDSVTYLGFTISREGVHTCPDKITAIREVAVPTNVSELRSFLGLVMYYAKFVPNISTVLAPLYELLKKDVKFEWTEKRNGSFEQVKALLISSEILAHYSPNLDLVLTTDASSVGVGAVISHLTEQGERPIAYASRSLNAAEKGYAQIEREALSIIFGVRKFHQYLYGRKFILRTDHKPLVTIFGDKVGIPVMAASRMQRWAVLLAGYNYDIEYVRSEKNAADALSRLPVRLESTQRSSAKIEKTYLNFVQDFLPITRKTVQAELSKDTMLKKVVLYLETGWPNHCTDVDLQPYFTRRNELYLDMGCIVWGYRLVIPSALRESLLKELHVGHLGIVKMKSLARSSMWWPGIDAEIERSCKQCVTCAVESPAPPRAPPQPWPYVSEPWSRLHVDFLGPIHGSTFLVIIDSTSKWIEIFNMSRTTASAVIKVLRETFARFGLPREVVSDNGPPFTSREYAEFMTNNGIKVTFAPAYHPASNGAAEGAVKLCKRAIKKSLREGCEVEVALQSYLMAYRNVAHSTTGVAPAALLQRRHLRSRLDLLKGDRQVDEKVQDAQRKQIENAGGTSREFQIGEKVWSRDYTGGRKWSEGAIEQQLGSRNYLVGREIGLPVKRHIDQIRSRWLSTVGVSTGTIGGPTTSSNEGARALEHEAGPRDTIASVAPAAPPPPPPPVTLPERRYPLRNRRPVVRYGFEFD